MLNQKFRQITKAKNDIEKIRVLYSLLNEKEICNGWLNTTQREFLEEVNTKFQLMPNWNSAKDIWKAIYG